MKKLLLLLMLFFVTQNANAQLAIVSFDPSHDGIANYDWINVCNIGTVTESLTNIRVRTYARAGTQNSDVLLSTLSASLDSGKCILFARDGVAACGTTSCDGDTGPDAGIPPTTTYNGNPATIHGTVATGFAGDVNTGANFAQDSYIALVVDSDASAAPTSWIDLIKIDDSSTATAFTLPTGAVTGDIDATLDVPQGTVGSSASTFVTRITVAGTGFNTSFRVINDSNAPSIVKTLLSTPLAISLVSAIATVSANGFELTWATASASESNNDRFEIEQLINNQWTKIGTVAGGGTTSEMNHYAFEVKSAAKGLQTFRIKQMDFDGTATYSKEMTVLAELPSSIVLSNAYPNPFSQNASFEVVVAESQAVKVQLLNAIGQTVAVLLDETLNANQARQISINAAGLPSGVYFYQVEANGFTQSKAISIVR